jgi:hypothetical protein
VTRSGGVGSPAAATKHPAWRGVPCRSFYCSFFVGLGPRIAMRCISTRLRRLRMSLSFSSTVTGSIFGVGWFMMFKLAGKFDLWGRHYHDAMILTGLPVCCSIRSHSSTNAV